MKNLILMPVVVIGIDKPAANGYLTPLKKFAIFALVLSGAFALLGCDEAAGTGGSVRGSSSVLSTPEWLRGNWTTQGADTTHAQAPLRIAITATNIRTYSATAGVNVEDLASNQSIRVVDDNVSNTEYKVRMIEDNVTTLVLHFRKLNLPLAAGLEYEVTQDGIVRALRYLRKQ